VNSYLFLTKIINIDLIDELINKNIMILSIKYIYFGKYIIAINNGKSYTIDSTSNIINNITYISGNITNNIGIGNMFVNNITGTTVFYTSSDDYESTLTSPQYTNLYLHTNIDDNLLDNSIKFKINTDIEDIKIKNEIVKDMRSYKDNVYYITENNNLYHNKDLIGKNILRFVNNINDDDILLEDYNNNILEIKYSIDISQIPILFIHPINNIINNIIW